MVLKDPIPSQEGNVLSGVLEGLGGCGFPEEAVVNLPAEIGHS